MGRKKGLLRKKWRIFLEKLAEGMTQAEAYLASGYRCSSKETARICANKLLRKINEEVPHRETGAAYIPNTYIYKRTKELLDGPDPRVAVVALNVATKIRGMQEQPLGLEQGTEIIILRRLPEQGQIAEGSQPKALPASAHPVALTR